MLLNETKEIGAKAQSIEALLKEQGFFHIDYFQREYRWQEQHVKALIEDLTEKFSTSYQNGDDLKAVDNYKEYYMGSVLFHVDSKNNQSSIIDGQQRITSITLLLIHLNNLQSDTLSANELVEINELIYSTRNRNSEKLFKIVDSERGSCLNSLCNYGKYDYDGDNETIKNMVEQYKNIETHFKSSLENVGTLEETLSCFIQWFISKVVLVPINTTSADSAYMIFETMNDRGLRLTPTEMLKGYVLSNIANEKRSEIEKIWKKAIQQLHEKDKNADAEFFHAWFRAKYAETMRQDNVETDFELISTQFHIWFKNNHEEKFNLENSDEFYNFFKEQFPFYVKCFLKYWNAQVDYDKNMPHLYYTAFWGIADSLQAPLLLSAVRYEDKNNIETINRKFDYIARYIETFAVRRAVNQRRFGQTSIRYMMFNVIKKIRNNTLDDLVVNLYDAINQIDVGWDHVMKFEMNQQNKKFVKHLLSRISGYVDEHVNGQESYVSFQTQEKPFEIEHIWADKFSRHKDEFEQKDEFERQRNSLGGLLLLRKSRNRSFNDLRYEEKVKYYISQNIYAQTLHADFYQRNPDFNNSVLNNLPFKAHKQFKKGDIKERSELVQKLCETIWSTDYFKRGV